MSHRKQRIGLKRTVDAASEPVTLSEAKTHLRVDHSDDDTYISSLITAARNIAENYTNSSFITQTWLMTMEYFDYGDVELRRSPLVSVTSVQYYNESNNLVTYDSSNYIVSNSQKVGIIDSDNDWPSDLFDRVDAVQITYVTGYGAASAVPQAIKQAILMIVGHLYENRQDVVVGSQVNKMPMASRYLLDPYKVYHQYGI